MLKATNAQAAAIIREVSEGGVEAEWKAGIDKILAHCDAAPSESFKLDSHSISQVSGLHIHVCDMIANAIMMS